MPSNASTYTFQAALADALNALRTANPEQAVIICDELLVAYPDAVRVLRLRGQALQALGDVGRAVQDFERVLDISPTDTSTALSYAGALSRLGRKEEAALVAQSLLDFLPHDLDVQHIAAEAVTLHVGDAPQPAGRLAAAQAQFAVGRTQQALNATRKLVAQSPDRLDARLVLAEFLWRDEQRIQAADLCQQILDEQPDCLTAHVLLAQLWQGADGLRQTHVRAVNEADPDHREVDAALGAVLGPQAVFEVNDVLAAPSLTGFAAEDVRDTSDDLDHEDHVNRLLGADVGPIAPQMQTMQNIDKVDKVNQVDKVDSGDEDDLGRIGAYSKLDWDRDDDAEPDGREVWLKDLESKSRPEPEGKPAAAVIENEDKADDEDVVPPVVAEAETIQPLQWRPAAHIEANSNDVISKTVAPAVSPSTRTTKPQRPARTKPATSNTLVAARSAVQGQMTESAIELYRRAMRANKQVDEVLTDVMALAATQPSRDWFVLLGEAYTSKGNIEAALEAYKRAAEISK